MRRQTQTLARAVIPGAFHLLLGREEDKKARIPFNNLAGGVRAEEAEAVVERLGFAEQWEGDEPGAERGLLLAASSSRRLRQPASALKRGSVKPRVDADRRDRAASWGDGASPAPLKERMRTFNSFPFNNCILNPSQLCQC